jgi:hypothetical protein
MLDFKVKEYRERSHLVIAEAVDRRRWARLGVRELMRRSKLSQKTIYAIVDGKPVRRSTLVNFMRAIGG